MRIITLMVLLVGWGMSPLFSQQQVVSWQFSVELISGQEYRLRAEAQVDPGWFIYSQHLEEGGPVPTAFTFETRQGVELIGETEETGDKKEGYDDIFGMNVIKYSKQVTFTQKVKLKARRGKVAGFVTFMTCDDERCLPPRDVPFELSIP